MIHQDICGTHCTATTLRKDDARLQIKKRPHAAHIIKRTISGRSIVAAGCGLFPLRGSELRAALVMVPYFVVVVEGIYLLMVPCSTLEKRTM